MFRKSNPSLTKNSANKKETIPSIITRDLNIIGNIISDGAIDFNGSIEGNIRCKTFVLREQGIVKGDVTADDVMIYGKLVGLIRAKNVQLYAGSNIEGVVMHESLSIEDGAFIDGKCKRTDKLSEDGQEDSSAEGTAFKALENIRLISG